ncbi:MAG: hypothetical protein QM791_18950 [Ferruginibacter sp.]
MKNNIRLLGITVIILFALGCKKKTGPVTPSISFYFRGTINGVYKDWTVTDYKNGNNQDYRYSAASAIDTFGNDCVNTFCKYMIEDVVIFQNNGAGAAKNYIAAGFNISSKTGDRNDIIAQFSVGEKIFGKPRLAVTDPVKDGVYVYYIDENGKEWCSHWASGDQPGSIFKSAGLLPQSLPEISCRNTWRATFSCTLYDRDSNSVKLDNCELFTPVVVN